MSNKVIICTGGLNKPYQIIDTIFAMDSNTAKGWASQANPGKAFEGVKAALEKECKKLGGNAVIDCQFEYRNAVEAKLIGKDNQVIEIFAYGTAVKYED